MRQNRILNTRSWLAGLVIVVSVTIGAFLMASLTAFAAPAGNVTRKIPVSPFTSIEASTAIEVIFTQGTPSGYATITASPDVIDNVELTVDDGVLRIGYRSNQSVSNIAKTTVTLTNPTLERISMTSAASLNVLGALLLDNPLVVNAESAASISFGEISGPELTITASSAASIYALVVDMDKVEVNADAAADVKLKGMSVASVYAIANSASEIILSGRCNRSHTDINGGGEVRTRGLIVENHPIIRTSASSAAGYDMRNP